MDKKWRYYYYPHSDELWRQDICISKMPEGHAKVWVLTKKEAKELAKSRGLKIETRIINLKSKKMAKDKAKKEKKGKDKKKKSAPKKSSSNAGQVKYSGSIALTKLVHVRMKKKNKKGKKIDCLVIPIEQNYLNVKDDAVYLPLNVVTKAEQDEFGQNGFLGQSVDSKMWKEASEKEQEKMRKLPILGNIKNWDSQPSANDTSGSAGEVEEDDDLPF